MIYFRTGSFSWNKDNQTFYADMSDLDQGGKRQVFSSIYNDACDAGFTLVSDKSGKECRFFIAEEKIIDGDLVSWFLSPVPEDVRKIPGLKNVGILIFND